MGDSQNYKDYSILKSKLGSPYFGKLPNINLGDSTGIATGSRRGALAADMSIVLLR